MNQGSGGLTRSGAVTGAGAFVGTEVVLGRDVRIGPGAVILDGSPGDPETAIEDAVIVGANATVIGGVRVGREARIEPGAVVTGDVPARSIVAGNPARIVGYRDAGHGPTMTDGTDPGRPGGTQASGVRGVTVSSMRLVRDLRGDLAVGRFTEDVPFIPARYFLVFNVPSPETRGAHAHRVCEQFLVAARGGVRVAVDDGSAREEIILERPEAGLYLPPMTWAIQYAHTSDAVLLVFASHPYDPADYIRDYSEFLAAVRDR